jgi:hypothetical protein
MQYNTGCRKHPQHLFAGAIKRALIGIDKLLTRVYAPCHNQLFVEEGRSTKRLYGNKLIIRQK